MMYKSFAEASRRLMLGVHPRLLERKFNRSLIVAVALGSGALAVVMLSAEGLLPPNAAPLAAALGLMAFLPLMASLKPVMDLKTHLNRLYRESPWALLAGTVYAFAGLPPLKVIDVLARQDALPAVRRELQRVERDRALRLEGRVEALVREAREARGYWRDLLSTIAGLERTGGDIRGAFRDLYKSAMTMLRAENEATAGRMTAFAHTALIIGAILPVTMYVMLAIIASTATSALAPVLTAMSALLSVVMCFMADGMAPDSGPLYNDVYKRIAVRYAPIALAAALVLGLWFAYVPWLYKYRLTIPVLAGIMAFSLPGWLEFKRHAAALDEIFYGSPALLRDVADEVRRGQSPIQALARLSEDRSYGPHMDRFLRLLVNKVRLQGPARALADLKPYLPKQVYTSLSLLFDADELGASPETFDVLADVMRDYADTVRAYKRRVSAVRWTAFLTVGIGLGISVYLFGTVLRQIALAGDS